MASTEISRLADTVDNAFQQFAHDNGDGFSSPNWRGAYDYRDDGYALAEEAFGLSDPEDHIESVVETYPESARYLIAVSAAYRMTELAARPELERAA